MFSALFLALAVGVARADEPKKVEPKRVGFEKLKSGHIAVQIKINGKGPYRLIFDTGAPMMLINNRIAKEAGVIDKNTKTSPFQLFGAQGQFSIKEFEMGDLKAADVATVVMDHPTVAQMAQIFGPIDGIVGFPFFARYRMTIDYQAKEFTFVPVDFKPTNIFDSLMEMMQGGLGGGPKKGKVTILAPAAQWGFVADKSAKDTEAGVEIQEVMKGSAAEKAGLKSSDRLLTLDGRWTDTMLDLFEAASYVKPGSTVPIEIKRDGKKIELKVTPTKGL